MANGLLGKAAPTANTWTNVYTVPTGKTATMNIRLINRDVNVSVSVRLALSSNATPASVNNEDYIEPIDYVLKGNKVLEDIALVAGPGEIVKVYASNANLTIRVMGFEANQ